MSRSRSRALSYLPMTGSSLLISGNPSFSENMTDVNDGLRTADHPLTHSRISLLANAGSGRVWSGGSVLTPRQIVASGMAASQSIRTEESSVPASARVASQYTTMCFEAGRSNFHAISFLRELQETWGMLKNPFKLISKLERGPTKSALAKLSKSEFRRWSRYAAGKQRRSLKGVIQAAEDTWLEGTYGWMPFVGDLIAATDLLQSVRERRELLKSKARTPFKMAASSHNNLLISGSPTKYKPFYYADGSGDFTKSTVKYYGYVETNPSLASENAFFSVARALNIDRLGYAAWDAVPYSFVVDWFLPLGDSIDKTFSGPALLISMTTPWAVIKTRTEYRRIIGPGLFQQGGSPSGGGTYCEEKLSCVRKQCAITDVGDVDNSTGMHGTRIPSGLALGHGLLNRVIDTCRQLRR